MHTTRVHYIIYYSRKGENGKRGNEKREAEACHPFH